jgi:hypothetical protein
MSFFTGASASPWDASKPDLYVFHFGPEHTEVALNPEHPKHQPLAEWCPTMLDRARDHWNLINGFECLHGLPHDAVCLITLCNPGTVPLEHLYHLKSTTHPQMHRILYTAEGPNIRHQAQWTRAFLTQAADTVLTYARHVLDDSSIRTVPMPHNARFLSDATIDGVCRDNTGPNTGTVAMVLEPRPSKETYTIDGHIYRCMDGLRIDIATGFGSSLTVVGHGWKRAIEDMSPPPTLGYDVPRMTDSKTSVDTLVQHDFAIIVENCDCPGYVSEKIGDALIAGAIAIYDGRNIEWDNATDVPPDIDLLRRGKGQWWLDIREMINPESTDPMGLQIRTWLEKNYFTTEAMIQLLKSRVRDVRREYLMSKGAEAMAKAIKTCVKN